MIPVPGQPSRDRARAHGLSAAIRAHVIEAVLPFWLEHGFDQRGRFWPELARDGAYYGDGSHALVSIARLVYSFSILAEITGRQDLLNMAQSGAAALRQYLDPETGAWAWRLGPAGEVADPDIRPYGAAFGIYALAVCGRVTDNLALVEAAASSFRVIWQQAREPRLGGIRDRFARDWAPADECFRLDTQLHLMEACSALLAATGGEEWRACWLDLVRFVVARFYDFDARCLRERLLPDLSEDLPSTRGWINYGHNLEASWFLEYASGPLEEPGLLDVGRQLLQFTLDQNPAPDRDGAEAAAGLFRTSGLRPGPATIVDAPPISYTWWVQCEGLAAIARHYRQRPSTALLDRLERLWESVIACFYDPAYGEWYSTLAEDGQVVDSTKGSDWKAGYHITQGCLHAAAALDGGRSPGSL